MVVSIRDATAADVEGFVAMKIAAWRWAYAGILPDEHLAGLRVCEDQVREWRRGFDAHAPGWNVLLGLDGGRIVAMVSCAAARDPDAAAGTIEVGALYVLPDHVGSGLGHRLLQAAMQRSRAERFQRATLWVLEANARGRAFYERAGWRPDGARDEYLAAGAPYPVVRYATDL